MEYIVLILIGLLSSIIGSLVGIGGGVIVVPALLFFGMTLGILPAITPQTAVGTSSMLLIFTGMSAMFSYAKNNQVDKQNGTLFLIGLMPGAFAGSYASSIFTIDSFNLYFGIFLIFISILLVIRNKIKPMKVFQNPKYLKPHRDNFGNVYHYGFPPLLAIIITFIVGFITGLFGIGGGVLMTPLMLMVFRMPPSIAIGTSMMMVFFSGVSSAFGHVLQSNVIYLYILILVPAAIIGANIGVKVNQRFSSDGLVVILRTVLFILGVYLILQTIL